MKVVKFKIKLYLFLILGGFFAFAMVIMAMSGAGSGVAAVPPPATEEKTVEYGIICSEMGVPWQIVILTDAIFAQQEKKGSIENTNPFDTALEFVIMEEQTQKWEKIGEETTTDPDTGEETTTDIYDWVYKMSNSYFTKETILAYIGNPDTKGMTAEKLRTIAVNAAANKSDSETRYIITFHPNTDYQNVLERLGLTEENIARIIELNTNNYMERYLSPEALERIRAAQSKFGLYQFNEEGGTTERVNYDGLVFTDGQTEVKYYSQIDSRWANSPYGSSTIGIAGCGPTSLAMVISTLTGESVDPVTMCEFSYNSGFWIDNVGSSHQLIPTAARAWGLPVSGCTAREPQRIIDALSEGKLVIVIMTRGTYTPAGHFTVLRGITEDGQVYVADPVSLNRSNRLWDLSVFLNESTSWAGAGGPFWIIG